VDGDVRLDVLEHVRSVPLSVRVVGARAVGYVLVVGGTCFYALLISVVAVSWIASDTDEHYRPDWTPPPAQPLTETEALLMFLLIVGLFAYIPIGLGLLRYGRRGVLYLRRFGYTDGTAVVTDAAASLGGRWRFVTLDDRAVVGQGPDSRAVSRASSVKKFSDRLEAWSDRSEEIAARGRRLLIPGMRCVVILIALDLASGLFLPEVYPVFMILTVIGVVVIVALSVPILLALALPLLLSLAVLPVSMSSGFIGAAVDEADRGRFAEIDSVEGLPEEMRRVKRRNRRVLAPRLAVLSVSTAIWREAVLGLAGVCRIALIDVSCPTDSIVWEIEQLTRLPRVRCIFVGEHGRLLKINERHVGRDEVVDATVRLVAGHPVLAYHAGRDSDDFVRALRSALAWPGRDRSRPVISGSAWAVRRSPRRGR